MTTPTPLIFDGRSPLDVRLSGHLDLPVPLTGTATQAILAKAPDSWPILPADGSDRALALAVQLEYALGKRAEGDDKGALEELDLIMALAAAWADTDAKAAQA